MSIFNEEKYGATRYCEACFHRFDVCYGIKCLVVSLTVALLSKGLVFYIFGRRIRRTNILDAAENKFFFAIEMAGLFLPFPVALFRGLDQVRQTKP